MKCLFLLIAELVVSKVVPALVVSVVEVVVDRVLVVVGWPDTVDVVVLSIEPNQLFVVVSETVVVEAVVLVRPVVVSVKEFVFVGLI
jgi:hypothetical protein